MLGVTGGIRKHHVFVTIIVTLFVATGTNARKILFDSDDCAACKITTADWARSFGYEAESYIIDTEDGYKLETFRIPHGKKREPGGVPVLFEHGANGMSDNFILSMDGNNDTYATRLADAGYDVWLANNRGSRYARHVNYSRLQFEYWNYTMDEWSCIDIKVTVDYVLAKTNYPSLVLVGHSMAGAILSMFLSHYPDYSAKVHYVQLLSPVVFISRNPLLSPNPRFGGLAIGPEVAHICEFIVNHGLLGTFVDMSAGHIRSVSKFCFSNKHILSICIRLIGISIGFDPLSFKGLKRASDLEIFLDESTQEMGVKYLTQSLQINVADHLQKYDYRKKNMMVYGTTKPPPYILANIQTNIRVYYPKNDIFIDKNDNRRYFTRLTSANLSTHEMNWDKFNHFDYLYGKARYRFINLACNDMEEFHREHPIKRLPHA